MARPSKRQFLKFHGPKQAPKRGNPEFVSSSFYVKRGINLRFDITIKELAIKGQELDRSDVLGRLMALFIEDPSIIN